MEHITTPRTLEGLPSEVRHMIFEQYFADIRYTPVISLDLAVDSPRSRIHSSRNFGSPLFLVSKQIALEAEKACSARLLIQLCRSSQLPQNGNAFANIPTRFQPMVKSARVYPIDENSTIFIMNSPGTLSQRLPLGELSIFPALKKVTIMYILEQMFILPTVPFICVWAGLRIDGHGPLINGDTERALLEGEFDEDIKKAMIKTFSVFDRFVPSGNRTFELRFSFQSGYGSIVSLKPDNPPDQETNSCWPIWNFDKKEFVAVEGGKFFVWEGTT